jgi:DNA-directed RNA polymerase specialized sigma24 family protein
MIATMEHIEQYYRENRRHFFNFFSKKIHAPTNGRRAEELVQDVFLALLQATHEEIPISKLDKYAWGIAYNKLKMLYRSADWKCRKTTYHESQYPVSYDEDALCAMIDGNPPAD